MFLAEQIKPLAWNFPPKVQCQSWQVDASSLRSPKRRLGQTSAWFLLRNEIFDSRAKVQNVLRTIKSHS